MDTERYCPTLDQLDSVTAIRAIHQAYLQLGEAAIYAEFEAGLNSAPALGALKACLVIAGHPAGSMPLRETLHHHKEGSL